jgi:pyruvate dehydrogenase E1 component
VLPEVLAAAELLAGQGIAASVLDVTSLDRLYTGWRHGLRAAVRTGAFGAPAAVERLLPAGVPIVTVHDAASHTMAWLGSVHGVPCVPLGVDEFGQSGSVAQLYRVHDLDAAAIVSAAQVALSL